MGPLAVREDVVERAERAVPREASLCVGFSGGLDSTVLLHILSEWAEASARRVTAVHVNHGLSPNAERWVKFCERFCANQGVPLTVEPVRVDAASPLGLEAAARLARYAVYAARPEPFVALAHHLDDQAETVLLQLLRGTGMKGIAAMPELRPLRGTGVQVFRPLLQHSRAALEAYAREHGLRWVEDESNDDTQIDRNFVRHQVGPLFDARHPGWRESLARFARHAGSAGELLEQLATLDGVPAVAGEALPLNAALDAERRANAVRAFLARNAVQMPSESALAEIARQLYDAREDAQVRLEHAGVSLVRYRGMAHIERGRALPDAWRVDWKLQREVDLGGDRGVIEFEETIGEGFAAQAVLEGRWYFAPRGGGETLRLAPERPARTLKNLLQEHAVPTWERERLPLLFHDGRLVWVPGVGIAAEYACPAGEEGFRPCWRVAGKAPLC